MVGSSIPSGLAASLLRPPPGPSGAEGRLRRVRFTYGPFPEAVARSSGRL